MKKDQILKKGPDFEEKSAEEPDVERPGAERSGMEVPDPEISGTEDTGPDSEGTEQVAASDVLCFNNIFVISCIYVYVTVPGKRDHLGNFFKVIATAGKSRL